MHLTPKLPPGRSNRKALAFSAEIHRLRTGGYSFEAIRLALRDVGVDVSRTTVKREAARRPAMAPLAQRRDAPKPGVPIAVPSPSVRAAVAPSVGSSPVASSFVGDPRSGSEIAEAFMKDRISNPLIRERMDDEARSD